MTSSQRQTSTGGTPVPQSDFGRIIELCDSLQQYEMYSRQWDSYAAMYLEAKEQSEVAEGQVPPVLDVEIQRAVDLFPSVEKRIRRYASEASELIDRLVMHRIVGLLPSIAHSRIRGGPPHDCGYFDWQSFSQELLAVRDEALRLAASSGEKSNTTASPTDHERLKFYNNLKATNKKITHAAVAKAWNEQTKEPCDEASMKQSCYRARKATSVTR